MPLLGRHAVRRCGQQRQPPLCALTGLAPAPAAVPPAQPAPARREGGRGVAPLPVGTRAHGWHAGNGVGVVGKGCNAGQVERQC